MEDIARRLSAFDKALETWREAALLYASAKEAYRRCHAAAYAVATGTGDARKAAADVATSELRLTRDKCEVEERAAYHYLVFIRGSAGERDESATVRVGAPVITVRLADDDATVEDIVRVLEEIRDGVDKLPQEQR